MRPTVLYLISEGKRLSTDNKSRIGGNDVTPNGFEGTDEVSELRREVQALKSALAEKEVCLQMSLGSDGTADDRP